MGAASVARNDVESPAVEMGEIVEHGCEVLIPPDAATASLRYRARTKTSTRSCAASCKSTTAAICTARARTDLTGIPGTKFAAGSVGAKCRSRLRQTRGRRGIRVAGVDCEWALAELSTAYAVALRMRHADARDEDIATALGIPPDGVAVLLDLAQSKLSAVLAEESGDGRS